MLSKFSVKKPLTIIVSAILVSILGFISFSKMTTDLLPSMDLPYVIVMTTYPGASPEKVELSVTKPLEQALATTSGIKGINSISRENSSMIMLEFEQGINMDSIIIEMNSKLDMVKGQLGDEIGTPMFMKMNPDMMPIMVASVDYNSKDVKDLSEYVSNDVIPEFERIEGVASVSGTGLVEESIKVQLNEDKINQINNKVLATVDSSLAEAQAKLDQGKKQIAESKKLLEKETQLKTEELVEGSLAIQDGKLKLEDALENLPKTKEELISQKEQLIKQKEVLDKLIEFFNGLNIPVSDEIKAFLNQISAGVDTIDKAIASINEKTPDLEKQLENLAETQKQIEVGKLTLTRELTKASITLDNAEVELNKAYEEFEKSRDEAYKKAGIGSAITKDTISKILMAENFSMPAGYLVEGDEQILVKVGDAFTSLDELENLVLFNVPVDNVGNIKLKDIAKVEMVDNSSDMYAKINGNDGVILAFQKQSTSSTAEVSDKVNEKIEQLQEKDSNLHITPLQDQGVYINIVISSVLNNLVLGGVLAVVILFVFLKNIKPTIIIALSIPISLLFAVAMMYFSGVTMNVISLAGLALGVGMLVDNSIVVIENIYRLRNEGMGIKKAAVQGASQVAGAIVASTLTTICVFLPIVFTDGLSRQLFTDMGLTIAYSLIASLIVALTLVPTISSKVLTNLDEKEHGLFDRFVNFYEGLLRKALRYKWGVLGAVAILLVISFIGVMTKGMILMPEMDSLQISVTMSMEKDTSQSDLREMSNKVIERITEIDDVETVGAMESGAGSLMGGQSKSISYYVLLNEDKKATSKEVSKEIAEKTKDLNCDLKINSSTMDMSALGGSGVEVKIKGDNLDTLKSMAKDIAGILESVEGTKEIQNGLDEGSMETKITVDKNKAMEHGLTVAQVYQDIASAVKSESNSTTLNLNSKEYPVVLVNDDAKSLTKEKLNNYEIISTVNGEEKKIKLTDIAVISEEESLSSINRENQVRNISVKAGVDSDHNVGLVSDDVEKKLSTYNVPEGYTVEMGGEKESMDSTYSDLVSMLLLAIVFIYAIMVAQFQSFLSPFIVLFTIPLAFTGGLLALLLTGFNLSMIAMLGFLVLAGVVVNNGIVFVDYVNQLRLEGVDKKEALIIAGRTRIRPILMTALTTILGLSTLAMGIGMGSDMIQPMAIVTIGGLTYATILTLFVVPIMYDILHRKELKPIEVD